MFFMLSFILGRILDFEVSFLFIPILYFIVVGICWLSIFSLIGLLIWDEKRVTEKTEPPVRERLVERVIEKPIIIEKVVEKPVIIEKKVASEPKIIIEKEEPKGYFVASNLTGKYHLYKCKWVDGIIPENRTYFKKDERQKAIEAGFKLCKTCEKEYAKEIRVPEEESPS